MKVTQTEAVNHIKGLLRERGLTIPTRPDHQRWIVFEKEGKQIGVDTSSGVWIRQTAEDTWQCICLPCVVSGAMQSETQ